jgi:hypothetical protein
MTRPSLPDIPEYWGGQMYPADVWGKAPIRGKAIRILHERLAEFGVEGAGDLASDLFERLVAAELMPDEMLDD